MRTSSAIRPSSPRRFSLISAGISRSITSGVPKSLRRTAVKLRMVSQSHNDLRTFRCSGSIKNRQPCDAGGASPSCARAAVTTGSSNFTRSSAGERNVSSMRIPPSGLATSARSLRWLSLLTRLSQLSSNAAQSRCSAATLWSEANQFSSCLSAFLLVSAAAADATSTTCFCKSLWTWAKAVLTSRVASFCMAASRA